jgi:hypothetical protein
VNACEIWHARYKTIVPCQILFKITLNWAKVTFVYKKKSKVEATNHPVGRYNNYQRTGIWREEANTAAKRATKPSLGIHSGFEIQLIYLLGALAYETALLIVGFLQQEQFIVLKYYFFFCVPNQQPLSFFHCSKLFVHL